jgi:hypothetical protein
LTSNISEILVCEKCGSPVECRRQGSTQGLFCTKCDWSVVTTHLPEIFLDELSYKVSVTSGDHKNSEHLKVIAKLTGANFLAARELLFAKNEFAVFMVKAPQVAEVRKELELAGLSYEITPSFPW